MTKQHLNLSIDTYILTKFKEKFGDAEPNVSAWIETKMTEFISLQKIRRRDCMKCHSRYSEVLPKCPECGSIEYVEKEVFE